MMDIKALILYEDSHILVCRKPAGLAVQSARPGAPDMESLLKNYLAADGGSGRRDNSASGKKNEFRETSGIPWIAVVHRLDQPVEGVLVFAKTLPAAKDLSRQIAAGEMTKIYLAVTCGTVPAKEGILEDYLKKDGRTNTSAVVPKGTPGSKRAVLSYEVLEELPAGNKLLRIHLQTGRHHQIRVQLAHAGMPLLGDRKYGSPETSVYPLALCAHSLTFRHPATKKTMNFCVLPEGAGFHGFQEISSSST